MKLTNTNADICPQLYNDFYNKSTLTYHDYFCQRLNSVRQELIQQHKLIFNTVDNQLAPSISVLDVGTGTGLTLIYLCQNLDFLKDKITGIDFSWAMIKEANNNALQHQLTKVISFLVMDVHKLNFPSNSFDLIIGRSVAHHWANPSLAFKEIFRVLKADGQCIIHEPSRCPTKEASDYFNQLRIAAGYPPMNLKDKYTTNELKYFLQRAGIRDYSITAGNGIYAIGFEICITKTN